MMPFEFAFKYYFDSPRSSSRVPGADLGDHLPDHVIQHIVVGLAKSVGECRPTETRGSSKHNGSGSWQISAVPPMALGVDIPAAGILRSHRVSRGHLADDFGFEDVAANIEAIHVRSKTH